MDDEFLQYLETLNLNITSSLPITPEEIQVNCSDLFLHTMEGEPTMNMTLGQDEYQEKIKNLQLLDYYLYRIVIPIVCVFGFFGNILNIAVFSKKRTRRTMDDIEYCTTICLVALAVSDMMFCLCTFPNTFMKEGHMIYDKREFMLYYKMCVSFLINTFIMSSTMLTVLTAIMRYTAICHPFRSRQFISLKKTIISILLLFFFSFAINVPHLWWYTMEKVDCIGENTYMKLSKGSLFKNNSFVYTRRLLWTVVGNFIPLSILLYCNIRLVRALHLSQKLRLLHSRDNVGCLSAHKRINITLITIIILFFILVAPSEITKFIFSISKQNHENAYTFHMVAMVTNTLQCINFSVNFILYYVIIAPFRKTIHEFICVLKFRRGKHPDSSNSQKQQTCVLLTVKDHRRNLL